MCEFVSLSVSVCVSMCVYTHCILYVCMRVWEIGINDVCACNNTDEYAVIRPTSKGVNGVSKENRVFV